MVGNDVDEDLAALEGEIDAFLTTDCLINKSGRDLTGIYPRALCRVSCDDGSELTLPPYTGWARLSMFAENSKIFLEL